MAHMLKTSAGCAIPPKGERERLGGRSRGTVAPSNLEVLNGQDGKQC